MTKALIGACRQQDTDKKRTVAALVQADPALRRQTGGEDAVRALSHCQPERSRARAETMDGGGLSRICLRDLRGSIWDGGS